MKEHVWYCESLGEISVTYLEPCNRYESCKGKCPFWFLTVAAPLESVQIDYIGEL